MLIIFTVKDQKVTHDLGKRTLVAGSEGSATAAVSAKAASLFDTAASLSTFRLKC